MGNKVKVLLAVEGVVAAAVASFVCWRFHFSWLFGDQGLHGDWFWFFLLAYVPMMLVTLTRSGDIKWRKKK
jgi:hypothetical protein